MSEISKFHAADDFSGELCVYATDFDRVTAERDALQERLNAADQEGDDLSFQLKDREGSRRDWLQAAKAAEKRVEALEGLLRRAVDSGILACYRYEELEADFCAALSASAEPCAPVERDERARFNIWLNEVTHEENADNGVFKVQRHQELSVRDEQITWDAWQARAALERKP